MHLNYATFVSLSARKLGASGAVIAGSSCPFCSKAVVPPGVDALTRQVHGETIDDPAYIIDTQSWGVFQGAMAAETQHIIGKDSTTTSLEAWVLVDAVADTNPQDEWLVYQRFGPFHIFMLALAVWALLLCIHIIQQSGAVSRHYYHSKHKTTSTKMAMVMRYCILIPELIGNLGSIASSVDLLGGFRWVDYFSARVVLNSRYIISHLSFSHLSFSHLISHRISHRISPFISLSLLYLSFYYLFLTAKLLSPS